MSNETTIERAEPTIDRRPLAQYFQDEVADTVAALKKQVPPDAQIYVANLLSRFTDSRELFVRVEGRQELEPLAFTLKRALESDDENERIRVLRRLGDTALYTSGFFPDRVERGGVEVKYYIDMGGMAYSNVSSLAQSRARRAFGELYERLAHYFQDLVHVLWEVAERSRMTSDGGLLAMYRRWEQTGSERLERKLVRSGFILPTRTATC